MSKTKEQIGELQKTAILNLRNDAVKQAFRVLNIAVAKPLSDPGREVQVQEAA